MEKRLGLIEVGSRRIAPFIVEGDGETARNGDGDRDMPVKSPPSVKESADCAGKVPVNGVL